MAQVALLAALLALARPRPAFVDRVEEDRLVLLEAGRTRTLPRGAVPGAREGDCVRAMKVDRACTEKARRRTRRRAGEVPWKSD